MKTHTDTKRRAKPTELKAGDDVLIKHTGRKTNFDELLGKCFVSCSQSERACNYC